MLHLAPLLPPWVSRPVELSGDARFAGRVRRLAVTAFVALGVIALLAPAGTALGVPIRLALVAGWLLMPATLVASLRYPMLRLGLTVPSLLVGLALLAVCSGHLPADAVSAIGWLLVTAGVWLGGILGLWFWYRLLPVPRVFDAPFSPGRWVLVGVHVGLVVTGIALVALGRLV